MAALTPQAPPTQDRSLRRRSSNVSDVVDFIGKQASKTGMIQNMKIIISKFPVTLYHFSSVL